MKVFAIIAAVIAVASANYGHQAGYGHGGHVQPYGHQVHAYAAHPPKVECGHNLLVSCQPTSAHVPCHPSKHQSYGHQAQHASYGHQQQHAGYGHQQAAPAYGKVAAKY